MRTYTQVINELRDNRISTVLQGEYYEYEGYPLDAYFEMFFKYSQELLDRDDLLIPIKPARIFFNTNTTVNAVAYKENNYFLIEFYKGTILQLAHDISAATASIKNQDLHFFDRFLQIMNADFEGTFMSFLTSFICYHEIGHLAQNAIGETAIAEEFSGKCPPEYVNIRHAREQDADWYAANNMVFHIISLANQKVGSGNKEYHKFIGDAISLFFGTAYWFFLYRSDCGALYYNENSHPHPVIRVTYTIENFIHTMNQNGFNFNYETGINNGLKMAKELAINNSISYPEIYYENHTRIKSYILELMEYAKTYPYQSRRFLVNNP